MESIKLTDTGRVIKKGFRFLALLLIIVFVTWFFKAVLFSVYFIPSGSMMPALKPGDYILVSKFSYSLRTPEYYPLTDIPFPFMNADGSGVVHRGDIMVFDLPVFPAEMHPARKDDYIKRCVGLPGDTVLVHEDRYYLQRNDPADKNKMLIRHLLNDSTTTAFVIPQKGTWIQLVDSTQRIWESILLRDGNNLTKDSLENVLVNGTQKTKYQVQQDYFFLQGDNLRFSADSRTWGLVPKSNLIGRAEAVIWPWPPRWL